MLSGGFYTVVFLGVLIYKLSEKEFGGKRKKQVEQRLILVMIQEPGTSMRNYGTDMGDNENTVS